MLVSVPEDYPPSSHVHICISLPNKWDPISDYTPEQYCLLHSVLAAVLSTSDEPYYRAHITRYSNIHRLHLDLFDNPQYKGPAAAKLTLDYPPVLLNVDTENTIVYIYTVMMKMLSSDIHQCSLSAYYWGTPPQGTILDRSYLRWPITPQED